MPNLHRLQPHSADTVAVPCARPSPGHLDQGPAEARSSLSLRHLLMFLSVKKTRYKENVKRQWGSAHVGLPSAWDWGAAGNKKSPQAQICLQIFSNIFLTDFPGHLNTFVSL